MEESDSIGGGVGAAAAASILPFFGLGVVRVCVGEVARGILMMGRERRRRGAHNHQKRRPPIGTVEVAHTTS